MNTDLAKTIFFTGLILLFAGSVMGQPAQSHPLSQIVPIDTDLDMAENSVKNVSEIILDPGTEPEGLVIDDLTITHEGRAQKLILDYNNNEWRIEDSDLNVNNNNISNFFGSSCPTGEFAVDIGDNGNIRCLSPTTELSEVYLNRDGDSMNGTLDMAGYSLIGLNQLQTSGSGVTLSNSTGTDILNIQESGATDLLSSNLEGVRNLGLVDSSNNDQYNIVYDETNGYFKITNSGEDVMRIDDSTNNLILPSGGLDMQNSNINSFFGSACAEGDVMKQVNSDGTFDCVDATGEVQNDFVNRNGDSMTGSLDMQGNNILQKGITTYDNDPAVRQNSDSSSIYWEDASTDPNTEVIRINNDYTVDIPNGNLNMNGNNVDSISSLTNYYGSSCPSGEVMVDVNNDGTFSCMSIDNEVQDTYVNRAGDTMTGSLDMQGNGLINPGEIRTGGSTVTVRDSTNGQDVARFKEGGNIAIPNGNLDMGGNNIDSVGTLNSGGTTLNTGGDVASGGKLRSNSGTVTSSNRMCIGDQCS